MTPDALSTERSAEYATNVRVRPVTDADMQAVLDIYAEGIATRNATFETEVPSAEAMRARWLPDLAWVAELDGEVVGWTAVMPTSTRECYAGVGESAVYVAERARRRGVGKALLNTQVNGADAAGMWTLQASVFPENRASIVLHHAAGYRTLAVRERIAQLDASGATPSSWNGAARWSEPAAAALPAGQRKTFRAQ